MDLQETIATYKTPAPALELIQNHPPLGLAGPTGAGKGTLAQYLTQTGQYAPIVSDTTRAPRPHANGYEVNGVHYWFLSQNQAMAKLAAYGYIEAKLVHGDTLYGTSIKAYEDVTNSGRTPIIEIDVQGIEEFMAIDPTFEAILLLPPSFEVWNERIDGRGDMTLENKIKRFKTALSEYEKPLTNPRFYPVINTEVVEAAAVIQTGAYKDQAYRDKALVLATQLIEATREFLENHTAA